MKRLLLFLFVLPTFAFSQYNVAYTVTVKRLMALADDCDGGAPFCLNAPQDPIFNIWTTDAEANINTNCWIFEDDDAAGYGQWIDIQNLEIANETGVNTNYINFDMSGFETDALFAASCTSSFGDDADYPQQFVQQYDLSTIPDGIPYTDEIDLAGVYFAEIEMDVTGRTVYSAMSGSNELTIELSNQESGMYFVHINADGKTATRTLILK